MDAESTEWERDRGDLPELVRSSGQPSHGRMAYLVMAHGQFSLLKHLLSLLDDDRNDIFIHVDAKVKELPCEELASVVHRSSMHFLSERADIRWGSSVQAMTELNLFAAACAAGAYSRYCLISGACLPLKSQDDIHRFFDMEACRGKNFIFMYRNPSRYMYERLSRYHFSARDALSRLAKHVLQCLPWIDRIRGRFREFSGGHNWCCLTHEAVSYLMEKRAELRALLKHTICADEVYKQLYLMNHPVLCNTIYRDAEGRTPSLWEVDWSRNERHPVVYTMEHLPMLLASPCLFARKFSEERMDVVGAIVRHVRSQQERG